MSQVRTYSPKNILMTVGGNPLQGFSENSMVRFIPDDDAATKVTGADGITSRALSANRSGRFEVTLKQTSPSNDVLNAFKVADELSGAGIFPVQLKDLNGTTQISAPQAWIARVPDVDEAKDLSDRVWMIDCGPANVTVGGNS